MSARTTADSSTEADDMHVSPAIAKPNVSSCTISVGSEIIASWLFDIFRSLIEFVRIRSTNPLFPMIYLRSNFAAAAL